jgi:hypothetical protein
MIDKAQIEADFASIVAEDPLTIIINEKAYTGFETAGLTRGGKPGENGYQPSQKRTVSVYTTDKFKEGDIVVIGTARYAIKDIPGTKMAFHQKLNLAGEFE